MYSLRLICKPEQIDLLSAELWEAGTIGIREIEDGGNTILIAGFNTNEQRPKLLTQFGVHAPEWQSEDAIDWITVSQEAWPGRAIGERFFVAPPWSETPTPPGRLRLVHNPGLACGTGEHPCTQLALIALEKVVRPGCTVADIGTGAGVIAIATMHLGATRATGLDIDCAALTTARANFNLNGFDAADLICGSAECLQDGCSDVTVANINASVLLAIWDDLLRITHRPGTLIITGFPQSESTVLQESLPDAEVLEVDEWVCLKASLS